MVYVFIAILASVLVFWDGYWVMWAISADDDKAASRRIPLAIIMCVIVPALVAFTLFHR